MPTKLKNASPSCVEYHALRGSYGRVCYFVTKTTIRDVAENLSLAPQDALSFTERIQRVINLRRVETEILPYLQENELRFFNALVCVLLPDSDRVGSFWTFEEYADDTGASLGGLGKLKITKSVGRVVLDGQHRFEALKRYWHINRDEQPAGEAAIEVALVFVVVDEIGKMGRPAKHVRTKTIKAARNLFAVLNKTARPVDKTTLLLIDDTDVSNVMTRTMIEENRISERWIKWTKAQNLQPADPYFTAIHVLKDLIRHFLRDQEHLDREFGVEDERKAALQSLYYTATKGDLPTCEAIPLLLNESSPLNKWLAMLRSHRVRVVAQPDDTPLTPNSKRTLSKQRDQQICFTVAGQRALFRAVIDLYYDNGQLDEAGMREALHKGNHLFDGGLLERKVEDANPFLGLLFDAKNRMNWSETVVDCARRIISIAMGSKTNRAGTLEDYEVLSNRPQRVVEVFWARCQALFATTRSTQKRSGGGTSLHS